MTEKDTTAPIPEKAKKTEPKNYKWDPADSVTITGLEYDVLRKTVDIFRGAAPFAAAVSVVDAIFARMITEGLAKEVEVIPTYDQLKAKMTDEYIEPESETINPS